MAVQLTILNSKGVFTPYTDLLLQQSQQALNSVSAFLELPDADVTFSACDEDDVIALGIGGGVLSASRIELFLDVSRTDILNVIHKELTPLLAHELHHLVRMNLGIKDCTLLSQIVSEGLACHFETEFNEKQCPSIFKETSSLPWQSLYQQMKGQFDSVDFSYPTYFLGAVEEKFPKYAGYWLGYNLVSLYIEKVGGNAADWVDLNPDILLDAIESTSHHEY